MASPVGVMTVLGLSFALCSGSLLDGFTGFTGETGTAPNNWDLGRATADLGDASAGLAATAAELGDPVAGMENSAAGAGDATFG